MRKSIFLFFTFLFCQSLSAQCPTSNRSGIHVVQAGQTLYRISKMYGVSVENLMRSNGISNSSQVPVCAELRIPTAGVTFYDKGAESRKIAPAASTVSSAGQAESMTYAERLINSRGTHLATSGETIESIAAYYGYTPARLREMNSVNAAYQPGAGAIIVVNECYFEKGKSRYGTGGKVISPQGNSVNTQPGGSTLIAQPQKERPRPATPATTSPAAPATNTGSAPTKAAASYMKSEELQMIDEVNLVRSNPAGYIPIIEAYKKRIAAGTAFGTIAVCDELIAELRSTPALSILQPKQCVYEAARAHGEDNRRRGSNEHVGTDGSWPWDRVLRSCSDLTDGNENLVGGPASVRDAVTILLIDDGIPNRGHRKTMLRPDWTYIACYKTGTVGQMPNSWVQKFGK